MLTSFTLGNFKSYSEATLPVAPLTVLVGANAAGKSNLIEAMQLLAWLAHGRRLADLSNAMKTGELPIRGLLQDLALEPAKPISLACSVASADGAPKLTLSLQLKTDNGGPRVFGEELSSDDLGGQVPYYDRIDSPAASHGSEVSVAASSLAER